MAIPAIANCTWQVHSGPRALEKELKIIRFPFDVDKCFACNLAGLSSIIKQHD